MFVEGNPDRSNRECLKYVPQFDTESQGFLRPHVRAGYCRLTYVA